MRSKMSEIAYEKITNKIRDLEINLTCSECSRIFKNPVIIGRCGHTFCHSCVSKYTGNQCPTCKVPIENKDAHDDKQLRDLIVFVEELKVILAENQHPNVQSCTNNMVTPPNNRLCNKILPLNPISEKRQVKRKNRYSGGDNATSVISLTPIKLRKSTSNVAPTGSTDKKRTPIASPTTNKYKRSAIRSSFSTGKRGLNKSPGISSSPLPSNLEKRNAKGETLLHVAVIRGDTQRVTMLLENDANPNVKDNAGWTPLHEACQKGFLEISNLLVKHGALVNVFGPDNITPLHDALINGHVEVAKFLVSAKADLFAKNSQDLTALDICQDEELKQILLNAKLETETSFSNKPGVANSLKLPASLSSSTIKSLPEKGKIQLIFTSLDDTQITYLQRFAKEVLNANVLNNFTIAVTHVITTLDKQKKCKRTIKILQGILCGKWIVSNEWIENCMREKKILPELSFEAKGALQVEVMDGPTRARRNAEQQNPPLFSGCFFYLYGTFNLPCPSKEILSQLIQLGGGKLLAREPNSETVKLEKFCPPYHATKGGPVSKFTHFILCQDQLPKEAEIKSKRICAVNFLWLVNSICAFALLDPNYST